MYVAELTADPNDCAKRNTHNRSFEDINKVSNIFRLFTVALGSDCLTRLRLMFFIIVYVRCWKHGTRLLLTILDWMYVLCYKMLLLLRLVSGRMFTSIYRVFEKGKEKPEESTLFFNTKKEAKGNLNKCCLKFQGT